MERLSHSKIDAFIVDCDLNGTSQLFHELNMPGRQFNTVPLVVMGKHQDMAILNQTGALFAFEKPISVEQAVRTLSAARCMILDGRLRYHRIGVEIPVSLKPRGNKKLDAHLSMSVREECGSQPTSPLSPTTCRFPANFQEP